jgi:ABC-type multidrug transport system fused ATPase/permease subunit
MHVWQSLRLDIQALWRVWLPLSVLTAAMPLVVLALPIMEKRLLDDVVMAADVASLPATILGYAGLWALVTLGQNAAAVWRTYLGERTTQQLRRRLFDHCTDVSVSFSRREHSARTMSLFVNDVPALSNFLSGTIILAPASAVAIIGCVAVMLALNWQLAVAAGLAPIVMAAIVWVVTRPLRPAARRAQAKAAELNERLQESLVGLREIVAFGQQHSQQTRFSTTLSELLRLRMRVNAIDTAVQTGQSFFSIAVTIVVLGYGSLLVMQDATTIGTLVAMRTLFSVIVQPISLLMGSISSGQQALGAADRIYRLLDESADVRDTGGQSISTPSAGAITFDAVSFAYQPGQPVLRDISFTARPGELIALVGPSGAGKSTLASMLTRFVDPDEGRVLLDGTDLRDIPLSDLRAQIGMVFQDTFLFATTIRENIAFGRPEATTAEIVEAARTANAWEFIEQLPAGLDTPVHERGVRLSEGQKQRLALARALLRRPRILLLDEPTSALDARSEHLVQTALERLVRDRTTFVIAHRLATVRRADTILVLEHGRIVEDGTHDQLIQRDGLYRELFDLQFGAPVVRATTNGVSQSSVVAVGGG